MAKNYYEILGVSKTANDDELKSAADYITDTNDRDGVAAAVARFVLRKED